MPFHGKAWKRSVRFPRDSRAGPRTFGKADDRRFTSASTASSRWFDGKPVAVLSGLVRGGIERVRGAPPRCKLLVPRVDRIAGNCSGCSAGIRTTIGPHISGHHVNVEPETTGVPLAGLSINRCLARFCVGCGGGSRRCLRSCRPSPAGTDQSVEICPSVTVRVPS